MHLLHKRHRLKLSVIRWLHGSNFWMLAVTYRRADGSLFDEWSRFETFAEADAAAGTLVHSRTVYAWVLAPCYEGSDD